jgi:hypothetical protein
MIQGGPGVSPGNRCVIALHGVWGSRLQSGFACTAALMKFFFSRAKGLAVRICLYGGPDGS